MIGNMPWTSSHSPSANASHNFYPNVCGLCYTVRISGAMEIGAVTAQLVPVINSTGTVDSMRTAFWD